MGKGLLFQFQNIPVGLVTAPATFSRLMRWILSDMNTVDNFTDDIFVYTTTFEEHLNVLKELFQRLRDAGFTAKSRKCSFAYSSLNCLVHVIGSEHLETDADKVSAKRMLQVLVSKSSYVHFWVLSVFTESLYQTLLT